MSLGLTGVREFGVRGLLALAAPVGENAAACEAVTLMLPLHRLASIAGYALQADRQARLLAAALMGEALRRVFPDERPEHILGLLGHDARGAPYFEAGATPEPVLCSFSHTRTWSACCLAYGAPLPKGVGIDLETPLGPEKREGIFDYKAAFSVGEWQRILVHPHRGSELVRRWTAKEAMAKALGTGFFIEPAALETGEGMAGRILVGGEQVCWRHIPLAPGQWVSLALAFETQTAPAQARDSHGTLT